MKSIVKIVCAALFISASTMIIASCEKDEDEGKPPNIALKATATYISADMIVPKDTTIMIGITASKAEPNDVLTRFTLTRSYDGGADVAIDSLVLTGSSGDTLSKDESIHVRNTAGTEKYTFTVVNKDGITASKKVVLTVQ